MADGKENLIPLNERTKDEQREITTLGGKASGRVRKEKASIRKSLEAVLNSDIRITKGAIYDRYLAMGIDISDKPLAELLNLGLLYGAIEGNATNYKTAMECNNEIESESGITLPTLKVELVDNSKLEKNMYEANKPNEND